MHVQEGFLHRAGLDPAGEPFEQGHQLAPGLGVVVGGEPDQGELRTPPQRLLGPHRRGDPVRPGRIVGRADDVRRHRDRRLPQLGARARGDGGEERVGVGVQDHAAMLAPTPDNPPLSLAECCAVALCGPPRLQQRSSQRRGAGPGFGRYGGARVASGPPKTAGRSVRIVKLLIRGGPRRCHEFRRSIRPVCPVAPERRGFFHPRTDFGLRRASVAEPHETGGDPWRGPTGQPRSPS